MSKSVADRFAPAGGGGPNLAAIAYHYRQLAGMGCLTPFVVSGTL